MQTRKSLCIVLPELANKIVGIAKGDPKKPKGEMPVHAFFVKTRWGGHTKKNPETSVNFAFF